MPDDIQRLIYKVEIDESGFIRGMDAMSASTTKVNEVFETAKKRLDTNEAALKSNSGVIEKARKDLENYTGTNERYRKQLERNLQSAKAEQVNLTKIVDDSKAAYDRAAGAAQNFATISQKAGALQTGGRIPVASPVQLPPIIQEIKAVVDFTGLQGLDEIVETTKDEFDKLRVAIEQAEERMQSLNQEDEEFKQLAPIVKLGREALGEYDQAAEKAGTSTLSLRSQIRLGRDELVRLEQAGKGATKEYFELEKRVASLTDAFGDQQQRIKILASDTRLLDFGKAAITSATSAFQAYTSIAILAGDQSEELQKKTMQLFAAMQLLTSLEQLSNQVRRGGVLITNLQSAAQATYTAVVGASTGALRAFRLALLATGVGAVIVGLVLLVNKMRDLAKSTKEASENQKSWNKVVAEGNQSAGKQIADLKLLTAAVKDESLSRKDRLEAVRQLQKEYPEYFGNLSKEAILTGDLTKQTNELILSIQASSRARAAKGRIDAIESEKLDREFQKQKINTATFNEAQRTRDVFETRTAGGTGTVALKVLVNSAAAQKQQIEDRRKTAVANEDARIKELDAEENFLIKKAGLDKIVKTVVDPEKTTKDKIKAVEDEFARKKAELDKRLKDLQVQTARDEADIKKEFEKKLIDEQAELSKVKTTPEKRKILSDELIQINTLEFDKAIEEFRKKAVDAREKINDELRNLQNRTTQETLNLIQDEFTRRAALIDFNEKKELEDLAENQERRLTAIEFDRLLIGEQDYQDAKARIVTNGEQTVLNIIQQKAQERQRLAADLFQDLLKAYDDAIFQSDLIRDKQLLNDLQVQLRLYQAGKISFQEFQNAITKIQKDAIEARNAADLATQKNKLAALDVELKKIEDKYSEHYKKLKKQRDDLDAEITKKETEVVTTTPTGEGGREDVFGSIQTDEAARRLAQIDFIQAKVQDVTNSVISFWQTANQAESEALDRSISLQEKRVDAARRIAERGNAQYLKLEEDRLRELQIKRENAARRQLGIDAALQASQVLVGITGAIAKIATPGIGLAEMITSIAAIVGALATGFALVKSLQGNQPSFAEGTTYIKRGKNKPGKDTIPAWLNEGEAVIPTDKNKNYKKAVEAIYYEKVPAEVLNEFVSNYVTNKSTENIEYNNQTDTRNIENADKVTNVNKEITNDQTENVLNKSISNINQDFKNVSLTENIQDFQKSNINENVLNKNITNVNQDTVNRDIKNVSRTDVQNYQDRKDYQTERNIKNIYDTTNENLSTYKQFVHNVSQVPAQVLNRFINNYDQSENYEQSRQSKSIINNFIKSHHDKKEISSKIQNIPTSVLNTFIENYQKEKGEKIPTSVLNNFINNYDKKSVSKSETKSIIKNYLDNKRISENINNIPASVINTFIENYKHEHGGKISNSALNNFINNYQEKKFFKGTPDLKRTFEPKGRDNIHILANEHEAILPADINQIYKPTVQAIFDRVIPAETINNFVKTYHTNQIKQPVLPHYEKIKEAAETKIQHDGRLAKMIGEQNRLLLENNELLRGMFKQEKDKKPVDIKFDKDGFAVSWMEAVQQKERDKKL